MSARVLKWDVSVDDQAHFIGGGHFAYAACQHGDPASIQVWTVETDDAWYREVRAFATGQPLPAGAIHLATVLAMSGALVWHLFDMTEVSA